MAVSIRIPLNFLKRFKTITTYKRTIMTTTPKLEKAMEDLKSNPYFEKYADRIATLQKTSPEEFLNRIEVQQKQKESERKTKFASVDTRQYSSVLNPKEAVENCTGTGDKKLDSIFKLELVKDKEASEIQTIWEEYHKNKQVISAIIPVNVYSEIQKVLKSYPTFLFPLPRSQGYEFIMCQSQGHTVHFTPLLAYQVHKENAPECLTMVHYTELKDKGIVLMRGEYDKVSRDTSRHLLLVFDSTLQLCDLFQNVLDGQEARCLANQFQMYYNGKDPIKMQLLNSFTKSPDTFKHMDLITQLENIGLQ